MRTMTIKIKAFEHSALIAVMLVVALLIFAVSLSPHASAQSDDQVGATTQALRGEIITGFTGIVELKITFQGILGEGSCTGAIIAPDAVLTAAHCFDHPDRKELFTGTISFNIYYHDPEVGRYSVYDGSAPVFLHKDYDPARRPATAARANADVAIIKIPRVFSGTDYTDYLRLYADRKGPLKVALTAYGAGIHAHSGSQDDRLRKSLFNVESVKKNHIVIDNRKTASLCKGDSGGPLIASIPYKGGLIPTIAGVASGVETGLEGSNCASNDLGHDDAFFSRTNWEKLQSVMDDAQVTCTLFTDETLAYRRCFQLPFIESVDYEGLDQGVATAIVTSAIR